MRPRRAATTVKIEAMPSLPHVERGVSRPAWVDETVGGLVAASVIGLAGVVVRAKSWRLRVLAGVALLVLVFGVGYIFFTGNADATPHLAYIARALSLFVASIARTWVPFSVGLICGALALIRVVRRPGSAPASKPDQPDAMRLWNALTDDARSLLITLWNSEETRLIRTQARSRSLELGAGRFNHMTQLLASKGLARQIGQGGWALTAKAHQLMLEVWDHVQAERVDQAPSRTPGPRRDDAATFVAFESTDDVSQAYDSQIRALVERWRVRFAREEWETTPIEHTFEAIPTRHAPVHWWSFTAAVADGRTASVSLSLEIRTKGALNCHASVSIMGANMQTETLTPSLGFNKWLDDVRGINAGFQVLEDVDPNILVSAVKSYESKRAASKR